MRLDKAQILIILDRRPKALSKSRHNYIVIPIVVFTQLVPIPVTDNLLLCDMPETQVVVFQVAIAIWTQHLIVFHFSCVVEYGQTTSQSCIRVYDSDRLTSSSLAP